MLVLSLLPADPLCPDCAVETVVKYGDTYHFPLSNIQGPITLEFR
jgi:hypothetical protein